MRNTTFKVYLILCFFVAVPTLCSIARALSFRDPVEGENFSYSECYQLVKSLNGRQLVQLKTSRGHRLRVMLCPKSKQEVVEKKVNGFFLTFSFLDLEVNWLVDIKSDGPFKNLSPREQWNLYQSYDLSQLFSPDKKHFFLSEGSNNHLVKVYSIGDLEKYTLKTIRHFRKYPKKPTNFVVPKTKFANLAKVNFFPVIQKSGKKIRSLQIAEKANEHQTVSVSYTGSIRWLSSKEIAGYFGCCGGEKTFLVNINREIFYTPDYSLQVGVFTHSRNADQLMRTIQSQNLLVDVEKADDGYFKVLIDGFLSKKRAKQTASFLKNKKYIQDYIILEKRFN